MKKVVIELHNGLIEIEKLPKDIQLIVKDYDTQGYDEDEENLKTDKNGKQYFETVYD